MTVASVGRLVLLPTSAPNDVLNQVFERERKMEYLPKLSVRYLGLDH